jgi:hypothetical protein
MSKDIPGQISLTNKGCGCSGHTQSTIRLYTVHLLSEAKGNLPASYVYTNREQAGW